MEPNDTAKKFGLKPIEQQMLGTMQNQYFAGLSNFLSFIALERLAYQVTPNTKFKVDGDTLVIWESEDQPQGETEQVSTDVATGSDTAQAMKGKQ